MINGNEYAWEDVNIVIQGKATPVDGMVEINYNTTKEHTNIYGRGPEPVGLGRGKKSFTGDITLLQSEVEGMLQILGPGKDLTDMAPFTMTVAYAPVGGVATVDSLLYVRFMEMPKGMKTGDDHMEIKIPIMIGKIKYNA